MFASIPDMPVGYDLIDEIGKLSAKTRLVRARARGRVRFE